MHRKGAPQLRTAREHLHQLGAPALKRLQKVPSLKQISPRPFFGHAIFVVTDVSSAVRASFCLYNPRHLACAFFIRKTFVLKKKRRADFVCSLFDAHFFLRASDFCGKATGHPNFRPALQSRLMCDSKSLKEFNPDFYIARLSRPLRDRAVPKNLRALFIY